MSARAESVALERVRAFDRLNHIEKGKLNRAISNEFTN